MDRTDLSAVRQPIAQAHGLPNAHYTDPAVIEEERSALLMSGWSGLAVAADVPEAGDAKPLKFLGMPLLLIRDRSGQVRVFHNICRHRGMILVDAPRKIEGAIRCPYHSWCYSTEGRLVSTPHVGGPGQNTADGIDRNLLGLIEVRSHIWMDVVWINLSGTAPAFEEANADLLARWAEFDRPLHHGGADSRFQLRVICNWKLAVENYCESYHLPWVHPGLNSYSKLEDHYHIMKLGEFSGQGTLVYNPDLSKDQAFTNYPNLSEKWDNQAEYISLFPNVLLGVHRDHRFAIVLVPQGLDRTTERISHYYADEAMTGPDFAELRAKNAAQWKEVFEEDIFVVEGMQAGRHGRFFDGGKFSPAMDEHTWMFHHWIASQMKAEA